MSSRNACMRNVRPSETVRCCLNASQLTTHEGKGLELLLRGSCSSRYGCTKWATEVQLQQLHREYGVPVSVFRCGMILAHSRSDPPAPASHLGAVKAAI